MTTSSIETVRSGKPHSRDTNGHPDPSTRYLRPDAPDHGRFVTKEEYWANYYEHPDASYEWNGGYLEAKPMPTAIQYKLFLWFVALLKEYTEVYDNGLLMGLETGFSLTVPDLKLPGQMKETVRKPDVAFIRHDNPIAWGPTERSYRGTCDLCVEVLSDSHQTEIDRDIIEKKAEYEFVGVQEYFILDEEHRYTKFYQRNAGGRYVEIMPDNEGILRSAVLPGFQWRERDLRTKPSLEALAQDPAYQGYVLLHYQQALAQTEALHRQAEAERQRAETEHQRAEAEQQRAQALEQQLQEARAELSKLRNEQ